MSDTSPATATTSDAPSVAPFAFTYKVGWLFEGGGAKGSFSFAAPQVLLNAGVPVAVVAGTSVGALTALLIGAERVASPRGTSHAVVVLARTPRVGRPWAGTPMG